jgi:hypothetical protein
MSDNDQNPELIFVLLPDGTTDPEEAIRKLVIPQLFLSCGVAPVPLDTAGLQELVAQRVHSQCENLGLQATVVDRRRGLYRLSGKTPEGQLFSNTVYVRPMWLNRNHSTQMQ